MIWSRKQQIQALQQQLAILAGACLQRDARVVELEAKLAELELYRNFVERIRLRVLQEEYQGEDPLSEPREGAFA